MLCQTSQLPAPYDAPNSLICGTDEFEIIDNCAPYLMIPDCSYDSTKPVVLCKMIGRAF